MKKTKINIIALSAALLMCFGLTACNKEEEKPISIGTVAPDAVDGGNGSEAAPIASAAPTAAPADTEAPAATEAEVTSDTEKPETDLITSAEETEPETTETEPAAAEPQQTEAPAFVPTGVKRDDIAALAQSQVGKMFFFGGCTPEQGFDNSGLVYYVMTQNGVDCPRYTDAIISSGNHVEYEALQKGDIAVFKMDDADSFSFVGIYIGDGKVVLSTTDDEPVKIADLTSNWYQNAFQYGISAEG